ncbi:MAG: 4-alpha-glucanotransferase [Tannerellaceae bacterium]|nr:4-alpha-glucanotransferase [Tannerellaceae bacterium]
MKISFHINYYTEWGQTICIMGSIPELGGWEPTMAPQMQYVADGNWYFELELPQIDLQIEYCYFVRMDNTLLRKEWSRNHVVTLESGVPVYAIIDYWQDIPGNLSFYTSAFTQSVFAHPAAGVQNKPDITHKLIFKVLAPRVEKDQFVAMTGNQDCLGNWNPEQSIPMQPTCFPEWTVELPADQIRYPLEYKFIISNKDNSSTPYWENGENRRLDFLPFYGYGITQIGGLFFRESLEPWRSTGTVIPVFSLRSEKSFGVGDLGDLKLMVDWVKKTNQRIIQVLPVNDTTMTGTWRDSYPYSAISIFALHPIYMDLREIGELKDPQRAAFYRDKQVELNSKPSLDYQEVILHKTGYAHEYFLQEKENIGKDSSFLSFTTQNLIWLIPYAAFCYYRDLYNTSDFNQWGEQAVYNKSRVYQLCSDSSEAYEQIQFIYYQQYILHTQFKRVSHYARENGVILKGDLPIGINRASVEAWTEPTYFNMNGQAGAPPDDFSLTGQNWGFPTYNWDLMEEDGFSWWKKRFHTLGDYFDCFRIDHILGFFRIWEIPLEYIQGLCGHFNPALPYTKEEIEQYGLPFNKERFTTPHIHRQFIIELFGEQADEVMNSFLAQSSSNHYVLKDFCDTQRKIDALFRDKADTTSYHIRQGLMVIANEVLFLPDPYQKNTWHPRISASYSYIYKELSDSDRAAFDHLYWEFYYHRHNEFWKKQALKRLTPLLEVTDMLVCGEDLGMIPGTVPEVMKQLQILSLEIERMPKEAYQEFTNLSKLPYLSVCTTSTHDMSPIRNWWKEDRSKTQRYYNHILQQPGEAPEECTDDIARQILSNHLHSPSMLTIIPLQDWLAMDSNIKNPVIEEERINIPANPQHYWKYRMHITLEYLLKADEFNGKIINLIKESGRK